MIYVFFESNHWFKDLDLFSSWCTFGDMAPKLNFAMKSPMKVVKAPKAKCKTKAKAKADPKPKADAKAKAKVKAEPPKSPDQKTPQNTDVEVSRHDQQLFNTFLSRSDDPRAESLTPFTMEWLGWIPRRKSLLPSGSQTRLCHGMSTMKRFIPVVSPKSRLKLLVG